MILKKRFCLALALTLPFLNSGFGASSAQDPDRPPRSILKHTNVIHRLKNISKQLDEICADLGTTTSLDLMNTNLGDGGAKKLATALETNHSLNHLNLEGADLTSEGIATILTALKSQKGLISLNIGYNDLDTKGVPAVVDFLKSNTSLTTLYLGHHKLTSVDAQAIAQALASNTTLKHLMLMNNDFDAKTKEGLEKAATQRDFTLKLV